MYVLALQIPAILFTNLWKLLLSNGLPSVEYSALLRTFQSTLLHNHLIFPKQLHLNQWVMFPPPSHHLPSTPIELVFFFFLIQLTFTPMKEGEGISKRTYMHNPCGDGGLGGGGQRWRCGDICNSDNNKNKAKKVSETISFPLSCLILWKCITESIVTASFAALHSKSFWWHWAL